LGAFSQQWFPRRFLPVRPYSHHLRAPPQQHSNDLLVFDDQQQSAHAGEAPLRASNIAETSDRNQRTKTRWRRGGTQARHFAPHALAVGNRVPLDIKIQRQLKTEGQTDDPVDNVAVIPALRTPGTSTQFSPDRDLAARVTVAHATHGHINNHRPRSENRNATSTLSLAMLGLRYEAAHRDNVRCL